MRALLVCPLCKGPLEDAPEALICPVDALSFPIVDGVPWMLPDEARPLPDTGA